MASLSLNLFKRLPDDKGRELVTGKEGPGLIHLKPNDYMTSYEWVENFVTQLKLQGNGYHRIYRYGGKITQLIPYSPDKMTLEQKNGKIYYNYIQAQITNN